MKHIERISTYLILVWVALWNISVRAQDEEDFPRLAKRSMNQYETRLKADSSYFLQAWHGGVYVGNNSRGRILPNGFVDFKQGRWKMHADVTMNFSDVDTKREEEGNFDNGALKHTESTLDNKYRREDLNLRIDYALNPKDVLALDIFQKYYHDQVNESSIQSSHNGDGTPNEAKYEEQERKVKDFNCGALLEHTHRFDKAGKLISRVYFKYDNKPTDIWSDVWGEYSTDVKQTQHQRFTSSDPKAQVIYQSPTWKGLQLGVREKVGLMNMRIEDSASDFNYTVGQTLTSMDLSYKPGVLSFDVQAAYETYHHDINDHKNEEISHTYRDWIYNAEVAWQINKHHRLLARYNHNIYRPTYTQLYPFAHVGSYIGSVVMGNEKLEPSMTDQISGRYTMNFKPLTLNANVSYRVTKDDITGISIYDEELQRTVKTWTNDATYSTLRFALEGEVRKGIFSMTMGVHAQHIRYDGENVASDKAWSYSFKMRPQLALKKGWTLAYVFLHNGRETHLRWYNQAYTYMALRVHKQLGDWAIYGYMQDLLREKRVNVSQYAADYIFTTSNDYNTRALILGCSYRF